MNRGRRREGAVPAEGTARARVELRAVASAADERRLFQPGSQVAGGLRAATRRCVLWPALCRHYVEFLSCFSQRILNLRRTNSSVYESLTLAVAFDSPVCQGEIGARLPCHPPRRTPRPVRPRASRVVSSGLITFTF